MIHTKGLATYADERKQAQTFIFLFHNILSIFLEFTHTSLFTTRCGYCRVTECDTAETNLCIHCLSLKPGSFTAKANTQEVPLPYLCHRH